VFVLNVTLSDINKNPYNLLL